MRRSVLVVSSVIGVRCSKRPGLPPVGGCLPVGFRNSARCLIREFQAAVSYSWMSPPRIV